MRTLRRLSLALVSCAGLSHSASAALLDPSGVWLVEDGAARIRLERCGAANDHVCGFVVWSKDSGDATATDDKNPDASKHSRKVLGHQMILGLAPEDDQYVGKIYNAENGKTYDAKLWREDDANLTLKGCVLLYLCGSQKWTKVDDVAPGELTGPTDGENGPRADKEWAGKAKPGSKKAKKARSAKADKS